jgi:hypothetical protein
MSREKDKVRIERHIESFYDDLLDEQELTSLLRSRSPVAARNVLVEVLVRLKAENSSSTP